jgi:metallo-beta-lactamase class B
MKWSLPILIACLFSPSPSTAHADSLRERWNKPTTPFRIIGNIYYVGTEGLGSYLITTPKGHILLDGGLPESAPLIIQNIQTLGFDLTDIKFLLNSHAHFDHSGGLAELKQQTGARLVASEADKPALEGGFYLGSEADHALDSVPVRVDRAVRDGAQVTLGDTTLTANLTPGHTRGCTSWSMTVREASQTFRVLFFCSASVALNRLIAPPQYPGIVRDYETTFDKAKRMQVDVFLAPHAEFFHLPDKRAQLDRSATNPFVDRSEFRSFINQAEADFRVQLAAQTTAAQTAAGPAPAGPIGPAAADSAPAALGSRPHAPSAASIGPGPH